MKTISNAKVTAVAVTLALASLGVAGQASAQVFYGVHCSTPVGVFGPGLAMPVGSVCYVDTYWGRFFGRIV